LALNKFLIWDNAVNKNKAFFFTGKMLWFQYLSDQIWRYPDVMEQAFCDSIL